MEYLTFVEELKIHNPKYHFQQDYIIFVLLPPSKRKFRKLIFALHFYMFRLKVILWIMNFGTIMESII